MSVDWHYWHDDPPPRNTIVLATYSLSEPWRRTRTCKHGCCVDQGFGSMVLPNFWKHTDDQTSPLHLETKP